MNPKHILKKMHAYMTEEVFVDEKYANVRHACRNNDPDCVFWAVLGECEDTPAFMLTYVFLCVGIGTP
jgi:hypothetical protein